MSVAVARLDEVQRLIAAPTEQLRAMFRQSGLKMYWVAEQIPIHRTTLQRILSGRQAKIRKDVLARLVFILETEGVPGAIGNEAEG